MDIRCKVWLESEGEMIFGKGRALLLVAIDEEGSLSRAAKRLNMSYRAAWGKLRASEEHLGVKLTEPSQTGRHGMALTAEGRRMLGAYERLLREAEQFLGRRVRYFAAGEAASKKDSKKGTRKTETPRAGTRGATKEQA
jgi:molybdate transport system regulatory protein